ncbi:unnamed protein product [Parnassius apollo]|uniref:(apollo) hypothetical protein n=1 Tax=Parnassius apollo TaxID=110799 RepID=A0A8S3WYC1_PARAO|nr:unnamed protein product [Parnassius apollo]
MVIIIQVRHELVVITSKQTRVTAHSERNIEIERHIDVHAAQIAHDLKAVTKRLTEQAKRQGSPDNISIIVVFLKDPRDIDAYICPPMDLGLDNALSNVPPYATESDGRKPDAVAMGVDECDAEAEADADNGVSDSDSEDLGPETAVDADDADADVRHHEPAPPTPPAHAVEEGHVDGVLVDNVAESGEDSEDEWNYYKGEGELERNENNPSEEVDEPPRSDTPCQDNSASESSSVDMNSSPLNPDAPVFVPGVVAGSDVLLAESPRKPQPMDDIELPDVAQFQTEAVIRPAELLDLDNSDHLNGHHNVSMDSTTEPLNGNNKCNMDSLGFGFNVDVETDKNKDTGLIQELERIQKDTTDYCDIQVFQAHTETNPFDDRDDELFERLKNKERDPMSMSFYQEKDDDTCERFAKSEGHVDLNAVQLLPDSDDEDIQTNGACDNLNEDDKENVSPENRIGLLETENVEEPNNDIVKFDDRTDVAVSNVTNLDNFMDYNINNANNMQTYSNAEYDCNNIPQNVLQTDTPESHKLLFEQIPEIPDGKSSELGFTNEDLQDHSESEREVRVITPQDEISQDIGLESKFEESPLEDIKPEFISNDKVNDIHLESDHQPEESKNEHAPEITNQFDSAEDRASLSNSAIIDQTEVIMHQVPVDTEENVRNEVTEQINQKPDIVNNMNNDIPHEIEGSNSDLILTDNSIDTPEIRFDTDFVSTQIQDSIVSKTPLPCESPAASLHSESPLPVEQDEISVSLAVEGKSPIPASEFENNLKSTSPLPAISPIPTDSIFEPTSPVPNEDSSVAPLPAEVPLPRESPAPSDSSLPHETPCMEEDLHADSSLPSNSPLPTESVLVTESTLPVKSPVPVDNLAPSDTDINVEPSSLAASSPLPTEDSLLRESPSPIEPSVQKELLAFEQAVQSESPQPTDNIIVENEIIPNTTEQFATMESFEYHKEFEHKESPVPSEVSEPKESPLPTDQVISESPLPAEHLSPKVSPIPTECSEPTLPVDDIQVAGSPLPHEVLPEHVSPVPESLQRIESTLSEAPEADEATLLTQTPSQYESTLLTQTPLQYESIPQVESAQTLEPSHQIASPISSPVPTEIVTITETIESTSTAPAVSPVPAKSPVASTTLSIEDIRQSDIAEKVADMPNELRLTTEEPQEITSVAAESAVAPQTEALVTESTAGPTPDIVPDERVDLQQTRIELVTDIEIGIPESRAQEICVPVTSEIQQDDVVQPSAATPPPTPAVEPQQVVPASLDIPPLSETPIAADTSTIAAAAAATAGVAAVAAVTAAKAKPKTPLTKKSPTTPTAKAPKSTPKPPTPRTPASATKKPATASASPASRPLSASKAAVARTSLTAKPPTPSTKVTSKPSAPSRTTSASKPAVKTVPAPAKEVPVKETPVVSKAAPTTRTVARAPNKPPSSKPAPSTTKTTTKPATAAAPRPITRPAARPASAAAVTAAAATAATTATTVTAAAKLKETKPKAPEKKPLVNGDVKTAKPAPKPAPITRPAPRPAPRAAPPATTAPAKPAVPRAAARTPLDKQSKDLANKRITAKTAPSRTAPIKAPGVKSAVTKTGPKKVELPKKEIAQNGLANGDELAKPPPSPPLADNALLPDVIA